MNPSVFLLILCLGGAGVALFAYEKGKRIIAWLFGLVAFLLVAGVAVWRDSLASLIATPRGIAILGAVDVVGFLAFWFEGIRAHKHHRVRTPVIAAIFGTAAALTIGSGAELLRRLGQSPSAAGRAMSVSAHAISSGTAARGVQPGHGLVVVGVGVAILAVLIMLGLRFSKGRAASPAAAPKGILGGKRQGGFPPAASRPGLPAGRRR